LEEPRGPRAGRLAFGQLDLSPRALRFRLLGNRHFQNALLELRLGVVGVDPRRQRDGAVEVTIAALRVIAVAIVLFLLDLLLAFGVCFMSAFLWLPVLDPVAGCEQ